MKIGLIGLPKSGKTTLFNLLTGSQVATARYDSGRAELHTGVARVRDPRVDRLTALFKPRKTTYATFEVVDLAGIERGERAGLETKDFRNADALLHVVRAFADDALGAPVPKRDIEDLETELILADLEVVERRLERLEASIKKQRKEAELKEQGILDRLKKELEGETPLRAVVLTPDEAGAIRGFTFLSQKPILHCLNLDEKGDDDEERRPHHRLREEQLHGIQPLNGPRQVHGALGREAAGHRHDHVTEERRRAGRYLAGEEQDDSGVGDEDSRDLLDGEPIARD